MAFSTALNSGQQMVELKNETNLFVAVAGQDSPWHLRQVPLPEPDATRIRLIHASDQVKKGRLTTAACPRDGHLPPPGHRQIETVEYGECRRPGEIALHELVDVQRAPAPAPGSSHGEGPQRV